MRLGRLYRSDDPIRLTSQGRATVEALGLAAAIDVRQHAQFRRSPGFLDPQRTFHRPLVDRVVDLLNPPKLESPGDVADIYQDLVATARGQIGEVVELTARHLNDGPVLIHCAYGKDRTGLIVALIQAAIGLPTEAIVEDYGRSDEPARRRYQLMLEHPLLGDPDLSNAPPYLFTAPAAIMAEYLRRVEAHHGTLRAWVDHFELRPGTVDALSEQLLTR